MSSRSYNRGRRRNPLVEQFAPRPVRMLESPAYRVLSHSAFRVMARIEIEFAHHGGERGRENGNLIVTYEHFEDYGIHRHAVGPAIRELVALGFLEITQQGCGGNAEFRRPSKYRLTYRHGVKDKLNPTNEWDRIKTVEEAEMIARAARRVSVAETTTEKVSRPARPRKQKPGGGKRHVSVSKTTTEKANFPVVETATNSPVAETTTTFDISGGGRGSVAVLPEGKANGAAHEDSPPEAEQAHAVDPVCADDDAEFDILKRHRERRAMRNGSAVR